MTKKQSIDLYNSLCNLGTLTGIKFLYAVAKNIRLLTPEIESFNKAMEMDDEMKKFDKLRVELAEQNAIKDDNGKPVVVNNTYVFQDAKMAEQDFEDLKAKYPDVVASREKQMKDFDNFLYGQSDINLHKVKLSDVPSEITSDKLSSIIDMIEDE